MTFQEEGYYEDQEGVFKVIKHLKDGIYYIKTDKKTNSKQYKLLTTRIEDLPYVKKCLELEPYRYHIAQVLQKLLTFTDKQIYSLKYNGNAIFSIVSLKELVDGIFRTIIKNEPKE